MVTPALGLIKLSLFIQYYLLFNVIRYVRISVYIGASLSATFYTAVTIVGFVLNSIMALLQIRGIFYCHWGHRNVGWLDPSYSPYACCLATESFYYEEDRCYAYLYDWWPVSSYLTSPLPSSFIHEDWRIRLLSATAASMASLYYRVELQNDTSDATWKVGYVLLWS
jgi:hypothetical protein